MTDSFLLHHAAGAAGAVLSVLVLRRWRLDARGVPLALFLGVAAGIYIGFGLADGRPLHAGIQALGAAPFLVVAAGWPRAIGLLACAWIAHGAWDLAHQLGGIGTAVPDWYPAVCLAWDVVLGSAALRWAVLATR
jgi:hypothetical protein